MSLDTTTCVINYKYPGVEILKTIGSQLRDKINENSGASYSLKLNCILCNRRENRSPQYICVRNRRNCSDRGKWIAVQPCYNFAPYLQIKTKFMTRNTIIILSLYLLWQKLRQNANGESWSQIGDSSVYFNHMGKKFSHKCDCIGRNFES